MDFLNNTDIVVGIGFVIFVGILLYFGLPKMIFGALDEAVSDRDAILASNTSSIPIVRIAGATTRPDRHTWRR